MSNISTSSISKSRISKLPLFNSKVFLAPMAGITDPAFRLLCKENGAGLVVTEFVSVHAIVSKEKELLSFEKGDEIIKKNPITEFLEFSEDERPVSAQLFGHDIDTVVLAAKIIEPYFDIIDFNMGCPAPHITSQMAGAALLDKPDHIRELFSKLVNSVNKPVTLKLRAGIDNDNCYLYKPIAKIAEECGISMITLHARTLKQGYSGKSDWVLIRELKEMVNIPVVGNGDVKTPEDAKRMLETTGCDYVMVGRSAMGNPLIFKQINDYLNTGAYEKITPQMQISQFFKYLEYTKRFNVQFAAIKVQAMQFTHGIVGAPKIRGQISGCKTIDEIRQVFESYR